MTYQKRTAGGSDTTTADKHYAASILSFLSRCQAAFLRLAQLLASLFRGLA